MSGLSLIDSTVLLFSLIKLSVRTRIIREPGLHGLHYSGPLWAGVTQSSSELVSGGASSDSSFYLRKTFSYEQEVSDINCYSSCNIWYHIKIFVQTFRHAYLQQPMSSITRCWWPIGYFRRLSGFSLQTVILFTCQGPAPGPLCVLLLSLCLLSSATNEQREICKLFSN